MAVLGNSDFALHEAEELSHTASRVTIFTDGKKPEFSRENPLPVNTMKIQAIEGDERVSGIRLKSDVSMQEAGTGADSFVPAEESLWHLVQPEARRWPARSERN